MASVPDQSNKLNMFDSDDGNLPPDCLKELTVQLENFDWSVLG